MRKSLCAILLCVLTEVTPSHRLQADSISIPKPRLQSVFPQLTGSGIDQFLKDGALRRRYGGNVDTSLEPQFSRSAALDAELNKLRPTLGVETLYATKIPPSLANDSKSDLKVLNILQSVSTLSGLTYASGKNGKSKTLYATVYAISSPKDPSPIPDPTTATVPEHQRFFVLQQDTEFGKYIMQVDYYRSTIGTPGSSDPTVFWMSMRNVTAVHILSVVPVIRPGNLRIELVAVPMQDTMLFYGNTACRSFSLLVSKNLLYRSFLSRIAAVHEWFVKRIDETANH